MKITLELPDDTAAAFFNILTFGDEPLAIGKTYNTDTIYDGAEVKIEATNKEK